MKPHPRGAAFPSGGKLRWCEARFTAAHHRDNFWTNLVFTDNEVRNVHRVFVNASVKKERGLGQQLKTVKLNCPDVDLDISP